MLIPASGVSFGRILALQGGSAEANSLFEYLVGQFHDACEVHAPEFVASLRKTVSSASGVSDLWTWLRASPFAEAFHPESWETNLVDDFFSDLEKKRAQGNFPALTQAPLYRLGRDFLSDSLFTALQDPTHGAALRGSLGTAARSPAPLLLYHRIFHLILSHENFYKVSEIAPLSTDLINDALATAFIAGRSLKAVLGSLIQECGKTDVARLEEGRKTWFEKVDSVRDFLDRPPVAWMPRLLSLPPTTRQAEKLARDLAEGVKEVRFGSDSELLRYAMAAKKDRAAGIQPLVRIEAMHLTAEENGLRPAILLRKPDRQQRDRLNADELRDWAANSVHEDIHLDQPKRKEEPLQPMRDFIPCEEEAHAGEALFRLVNGDDYFFRLALALSPYGYAMGLRNWIEQVYLRQLTIPAA